jgi:predicted nucleotidyltransferase
LANYGKAHNGAFHLFGSAVSGPIHDASDVDILVDFPPDRVFDACEFAEKACFELGLQPDVRPMI